MSEKKQLLKSIFISTFYLSAFTFGGGYVIITLMKKKFVDELKWIDENEMLNETAIAQSAPGPIAVNLSILLGYKLAGILGAAVSILGTILPPLIILSILSLFYTAFRDNIIVNAVLKGMQAGVAAIIADVVLQMGQDIRKEKNILSIFIMIGAFIATYLLNINVMYIILGCIFIGIMKVLLQKRRRTGNDIS
ncbi:chromate transporter [Mobilisporobacter senegalensis]|uniref:Chromate transporter n=1 Tax=Mobilisporobacter senegalensis TaxID=1329262 RepID=A0A3N1XM82_9FIRM|nr:chromate transporter [Mobilisporobacter senegalensis]ROR27261.1 chromate transporter [Mobilisporobacter senegalensis]